MEEREKLTCKEYKTKTKMSVTSEKRNMNDNRQID